MLSAKKNTLTPARRQLIELMSNVQFGHIDRLLVRAGEPILDPLPTATREVKFGADADRGAVASQHDFTLKRQVIDLFEQFDRLWDGEIERLEVKHGLPFRALISDRTA